MPLVMLMTWPGMHGSSVHTEDIQCPPCLRECIVAEWTLHN
uniref:Uncharacterized protein n=1 Tax=Arundo donax TaxID=35708 RepID=A0A0A8ZJA6_ARUDO